MLKLNPETEQLLNEASRVYHNNFSSIAWYGRCIFLSWYCDLGTCKFCFRSTIKHKIKFASNAKRTLSSVLVEALLCKKLGWRIEFLTGGYNIYPLSELVNIAKLVNQVYGEKIWLNLGVIMKE
ncbi:radical SAM protein, partial [Candidatus Woesearchaeota archaeon]|nr:radical SAM protein [Candidatus Woesearchaeota archaeon]